MKQMTLSRWIFAFFMMNFLLAASALASTSKKTKAPQKSSVAQEINSEKWNRACDDLLKNSVKSTLALEKSLAKKKKKFTRAELDEKVQSELLVVQLNAWVCAVSSHDKVGALVEEQFLKEYSERVQKKRKL